jgi:hypothetical protein
MSYFNINLTGYTIEKKYERNCKIIQYTGRPTDMPYGGKVLLIL